MQKLREYGILFGVASGRNIGDLQYIVGMWEIKDIDVIVGEIRGRFFIENPMLNSYFVPMRHIYLR